MSALEMEIAETMRTLDPLRAKALETAIHSILTAVRPEKCLAPEIDSNGWPVGYWESVVGCLDEGDDWQPSEDPPPEPHPY